MDVKRLLLVIPLAVVAYLMVIQWNKDYDQPAAETQAPQVAAQAAKATAQGLEAPSSSTTANTAAGLSTPDTAASTPSSNLIEIKTDVLDLRIDPQGGDVVYAALLEHKQNNASESPFVLLSDNQSRSYVAKSGLQLEGHKGRIAFSADSNSYTLGENDDNLQIDLKADVNGVAVIKRFTVSKNSYQLKVDYLLDNQSQQPTNARFIGQLARDNSADPSTGGGMGMKSYLGAAFSSEENHYQKIDFDDIQDGSFKNADIQGGWVSMIQHYFVSAWVPAEGQKNLYYTSVDKQQRNVAAFASPSTQIAAGQQAELGATLYVGPKDQDQLEATAPYLELVVDFGWLWFLANPLFWLLEHIHALVGNWGASIILLTVLVKVVLFPLSATAYRSMAKMRKMGPEMQRIKEKYGSDRQKVSQEMMKFYQTEKINPLGGCLPIVIQMPVFIALYWMLMESVELRHAPFMLWIQDLSMKDPLFILPIIMGATMFIQQQLNPTPPDPTQAKIMKMLPIVFTFFFLWFPAGLVLYWIVNNTLSITQQYFITRQIEKAEPVKKSI